MRDASAFICGSGFSRDAFQAFVQKSVAAEAAPAGYPRVRSTTHMRKAT